MDYAKLKVTVPEGLSGSFEIKKFTVTKEQERYNSMMAAIHGSRRSVDAGTYTGLYVVSDRDQPGERRHLLMSDTPDEMRDHWDPIHNACGHVLINGLGIGMVLQAVACKPSVTKVTVVEISQDVISLVWPHYQKMFGDKIGVVLGDAYKYQPPRGESYGYVWHDIWDAVCSDNLEQMAVLHRKYGRRTIKQGSWCKGECQAQKRRSFAY